MNGYIYIIKNLVTGKHYIGQTTRCAKTRIRDHLAGRGSEVVGLGVKKHGLENFISQIIEVPVEQLDQNERDYIKAYNCLSPNGYNLDSGGHKNKTLSEEHKKKLSEAKQGEKHPFFGKVRPVEVGQKISKAKKGKTFSAEHKRKLSKARKGRKLSSVYVQQIGEASKGRKHSDESKQRMSEAQKGNKNNLNKPLSAETKIKISEALKGRVGWNKSKPLSAEHKRKIGEGQKGKVFSDETRRKMSESAKRRHRKNKT